MYAKTLQEFIKEYRNGFNPITGEPNLMKDLTDQMIWDAAIRSLQVEKSECTHQHTHIENLTSGSICDDCGEQL